MRMDVAAQTDVGRRKKNNEDSYGVFREDTPGLKLFSDGALLCVADGLGGHVGGEIASKLAVSLLKDCLKEIRPAPAEDASSAPAEEACSASVEEVSSTSVEEAAQDNEPILNVLRAAIAKANDNIFRTNKDFVKSGKPMGTTLLAALVEGRKAYIANVGDSRCYHIRDGEIIATTEDHSWVDEQVKLGLMSRAEAESDYRRNFLTRSIGTHPEVPVDTYVWHVVQGDRLLLCTDGLVNMVKDGDISAVFKRRAGSADYAHRLVSMALENGGRDNVTVVVAHISPTLWHSITLWLSLFRKRHGAKVLTGLIALLAFALGVAAGWWWRGR